jgi:hypothetical protein
MGKHTQQLHISVVNQIMPLPTSDVQTHPTVDAQQRGEPDHALTYLHTCDVQMHPTVDAKQLLTA